MTQYSDLFSRADSSDLGADWSEEGGDWAIAASTLRQNTAGGSDRYARFVPSLGSADYDSEVDCRTDSNSIGLGPVVRGQTGAVTYYTWQGYGGDFVYLVEITGGSISNTIATGGSMSSSAVVNLRMNITGTTMQGYIDDVASASGSDPSLATGAPGVASFGALNGTTRYADNFMADDFGGGGIWGRLMALELNRRVTA